MARLGKHREWYTHPLSEVTKLAESEIADDFMKLKAVLFEDGDGVWLTMLGTVHAFYRRCVK